MINITVFPADSAYELKMSTWLEWMIMMPCDEDPVECTVNRTNFASNPMFELSNL